MHLLAWALYGLIVVASLFAAAFTVFHILRYSLRRTNALLGTALFLFVFFLLLIANIVFFVHLPLETLLNNSTFVSPTDGF